MGHPFNGEPLKVVPSLAMYWNCGGITAQVRFGQKENAYAPIKVTVVGITTVVNRGIEANALGPMERMEVGITIEYSPLRWSMLSGLADIVVGMKMLASDEQDANALFPILVIFV